MSDLAIFLSFGPAIGLFLSMIFFSGGKRLDLSRKSPKGYAVLVYP